MKGLTLQSLLFLCFLSSVLFAQDPPGAMRLTNQMMHSNSVNSVCFSADGRYALSGSYDQTLKLWEISTGKEIRTLAGHSGSVTSVCFNADGRYALSGSDDKTVKLWEVSTGKEIRTLTGHSYAAVYGVYSVCFSPDGHYALSGSGDGTVKLWEVSTGKEIRTLVGHSSDVTSVCFSADGRYALSGSTDKTVKLWEVSTGKEIRTLTGHTYGVNSVCFSADGRYALSGSGDGTLKLWEVSKRKEIKTWSFNYSVSHASFASGGETIQVGTMAYFVSLPLPKFAIVKPQIPTSVFSQIIWTSEPITVRAPEFTAQAVLVSNYPAPIQAGQIRLYRNGQIVTEGQKLGVVSLKAAGGRVNWQRTIPPVEGNNELVLGLTLPNQPEVRTEPLVVQYLPPTKPNLYVLTIGVPGMGLKHPAKDAEGIGELFKKQEGKLFNRVIATTLTKQGQIHTTRLRNEMSKLPLFGITPNDILLVFISAHGKKLNLSNGQTDFAIQPDDYDGTNIDTEENTTLRYKIDIIAKIERIPCLKMIWLDACHSGEAVLQQGGKDRYLRDLREAQEIIKRTPASIVTLSSSSDGQLSWEDDSWEHGAFTKALLDGLTIESKGLTTPFCPADANKDGLVWVSELFQYIQTTIPPLVQKRKGATQVPQMYPGKLPEHQDFPLFSY